MPKTVRVTLEITPEFMRHFHVNQILENQSLRHDQMTASQLVARLVYLEARGAPEDQIHSETPMGWRADGPNILHEERRVYENGQQLSGPELVPKPKD